MFYQSTFNSFEKTYRQPFPNDVLAPICLTRASSNIASMSSHPVLKHHLKLLPRSISESPEEDGMLSCVWEDVVEDVVKVEKKDNVKVEMETEFWNPSPTRPVEENHEEYSSSTEAPSSPFQRMICQRFEQGVYGSPKSTTLPDYTISRLNGAFASRQYGLLPSGFQSLHERPRHFTIGHHHSNILRSPDEPSPGRARYGSEAGLPCYERYSDAKLSPSDVENEAEESNGEREAMTEIGERDQPIFQHKQFHVREIEPDWTTSDIVLADLLSRFPKKNTKIFSDRVIYDSHKQPQRSRIRLSLKRLSDSYTKKNFIKRLKTEASR